MNSTEHVSPDHAARPMREVLIAGCGDVGTELGLQLAASGVVVHGLRRSAAKLPAAIHGISADLGDPSTLSELPPGIDTLFYTAAADGRDEVAYRRAYIDGLDNVLSACEGSSEGSAGGSTGLRRVLFTSSTSVYGVRDGSEVDESTPAEPLAFTGRVLLEAEARARAAAAPAVAVRFGGIYGPGRTRLIRLAQAGEPCVHEPPVYTNRIHRDDCAAALAHLARIDAPAPVYVAVDTENAPQCEVMDWMAERLGVPPPQHIAASPAQLERGSKRCLGTRLRDSGYRFRYPSYREGYAAVLDGVGHRHA